ncbi:hypothetical protein HOT95_gp026 [Vibrio phage vB_VpS_PG07]|uniref:Uncharacterized protein n=1 Tax=Vibrio phage vB_VpS_PG07 TaxID=2301664 RepID=A0A385E4D7_9CAUD|nr:hypothetical protein HOT95_gp026 [Vibrio phage vB_VpS_PG07]AXQ66651.1 hypothetical protein [Vibrio phage vB_VpS_PG07]
MEKNYYVHYVSNSLRRFGVHDEDETSPEYWRDAEVVGPFTEDAMRTFDREACQDVASASGESEWEVCPHCDGEGTTEDFESGEPVSCGDCGGHGGWEEDWNDFVNGNTESIYEVYNPELHYMARSKFPEHLAWKKKDKMQKLANTMEVLEREKANALKEVRRQTKMAASADMKWKALAEELAKMERE